MIKKTIKAVALACAMLVGLSATGCASKSWAVKVDKISVPTQVYLYFLTQNREIVLETAQASSSSSSVSSSSTGLVRPDASSSSSAASAADPWSQTIAGTNAYTWALSSALKSSEEYAMAAELSDKNKIAVTSSESAGLASYVSQNYSSYTFFKNNGVTQDTVQKVFTNSYFFLPKLIDIYYGKNGSQPVSDSDLLNYYNANYVDIKQIFLNINDDNQNPLPADQQKKIEATATTVYNQLSADKSKFDSLLKEYNQDSGMTSQPAGYIFSKSNNYIQDFSDAAFSMKVGEVKMIKSVYGYHIMYKVPNNTTASIYNDTEKEDVLQSMKSADMMKVIDDSLTKAKIVTNKSAIDKYNPKTLKD